MKKLKQNVSEYSDQIPVDLLIDILLRVPSKSIARFRCVSKLWSSILCDPDFIKSFLTKSLTRPRLLFTFEQEGKLFVFSSPQTRNQDKKSPPVVAEHLAYFPTDFSSKICGSVNGLICRQDLKRKESVTEIHNLSTGECVTLPEVTTETIKSRSYFGYDPVGKKFKVLCMTWSIYGIYNRSQGHRVLTLTKGKKLWRKVEYCRPHFPLYDGICISGVLYYPAENQRCRGVSMIVCFDFRSEKFSYINIGQDMVIKRDSTLINYKGKLGVLHARNYRSRRGVNKDIRNFLLWILEDAEEHVWSKRICKVPHGHLKRHNPDLYFVGLAGTGEIVLSPYFLYDPFYVFFYNLESNTIRRVKIRGFEAFKEKPKVHIFIDYVENVTPMQMLRAS